MEKNIYCVYLHVNERWKIIVGNSRFSKNIKHETLNKVAHIIIIKTNECIEQWIISLLVNI